MKENDTAPLSLQYQENIRQITQPFLQKSDSTFFTFERLYENNQGFYLSNNCDVNNTAIENSVVISYASLQDTIQKNHDINIIDNNFCYLLKESNKICEQLINKRFDLKNTFVILEQHEGYVDAYSFSSNLPEQFARFCFNEFDRLAKFKKYFKDSAQLFINELDNSPIQMSINYTGDSTLIENTKIAYQRQHPEQSDISGACYITLGDKIYRMSKDELACLKCLTQGRTLQDSSDILKMTREQIANHLDQLHRRFDLNNSQLIALYLASDLIID